MFRKVYELFAAPFAMQGCEGLYVGRVTPPFRAVGSVDVWAFPAPSLFGSDLLASPQQPHVR
jgi:hypothetical protein